MAFASSLRLYDEIDIAHADVILIIFGFASAMVDTMTVPTTKTFVANNTGNWILLALGAVGLADEYPLLVFPVRCIVALCGSWTGSFVNGQLGRIYGVRKRWFLLANSTFEALMIWLCVILLYTNACSMFNTTNLVILFLLSWVFGSQGAVTKAMGVKGIPMPAVVTGAMGDLLSDPRLFAPLRQNRERNQRIVFLLTFFIGAIMGGIVLRWANASAVLVVTASIKLVGGFGWLLLASANAKGGESFPRTLTAQTTLVTETMEKGEDQEVVRCSPV